MRELARHVHEHPDGSQREYSRGTLDRWIRVYREQGLDGLKPESRSDLGEVRRANAALERSCAVLGIHLIHSRPYSPLLTG